MHPRPRRNHARDNGKQRPAHLRNDKDKGQCRRVDLGWEELAAYRDARGEDGAGEEADEADGDGRGDDVGDAECVRVLQGDGRTQR